MFSKTKNVVPFHASAKSTRQQHSTQNIPANPIIFETANKGIWAKTIDGKQFFIRSHKNIGIVIFTTKKIRKIFKKKVQLHFAKEHSIAAFRHTSNSIHILANFFKFKSVRLFLLFSLVSRRFSIGSCLNVKPTKWRFLEFEWRPEVLSKKWKSKFQYNRDKLSDLDTQGVFFNHFTKRSYRKVPKIRMAKNYSPMEKLFFRKFLGWELLPRNDGLACIFNLLREPWKFLLFNKIQQKPISW